MRNSLAMVLLVAACSNKTSSPAKTEGSAAPGSAVTPAAVVADAAPPPAPACVPPSRADVFVRAAGSDAELCWTEGRDDACVHVDASGKAVRTTSVHAEQPPAFPSATIVDDAGAAQDSEGTQVKLCATPTDCRTIKPGIKGQVVVDAAVSSDGTLVAVTTQTDIRDRGTLLLFDGQGKQLDKKPLTGGDDVHPGGNWRFAFADHTLVETFTAAAVTASHTSLLLVDKGKLRAAGSSNAATLDTVVADKKLFVLSQSDDDLHVEAFDLGTGKLAFENDVKGLFAGAPDDPTGERGVAAAAVGTSVVVTATAMPTARLAFVPLTKAPATLVELPVCQEERP